MSKSYIIAELSANHQNDKQIALKTIDAIKDSGANAVKVQTFTADSMTLNINSPLFMAGESTIWAGRKLYDLYAEAALPLEWHAELKNHANSLGLDFFSSPFDKSNVDFLESINVPIYKVASLEITDIPLIKYIAEKGKPIILSTGVAKLSDIELAVETCRKVGNDQITLLKCTSAYPTPYEEVNLRTIPHMQETFGVKVGISDHSMGSEVAIGAIALGATVIEKHFILDRSMGGADSSFSMEPHEFKQMVEGVRNVELALGKVEYSLTSSAIETRGRARSLFISEDLRKGDVISEDNIKVIRPGNGIHPKYFWDVQGLKTKCDIKKGTPLSFNDLYYD